MALRLIRDIEGREAFKQFVTPFYAASPDLRLELHDLIAERDLVVTRYTTTGTHQAEFSGLCGGRFVAWVRIRAARRELAIRSAKDHARLMGDYQEILRQTRQGTSNNDD